MQLWNDSHHTLIPEKVKLRFRIEPQPTDTSCGPTCLRAVYRYYGDDYPLENLMKEIPVLDDGGTLAVHLGNHALQRGYQATLYTYNLQIFDPTWFRPRRKDLRKRLHHQATHRPESKRRHASEAYLQFVDLGGKILLDDLNGYLIRSLLKAEKPILTGLSSTFLYRAIREIPETDTDDDLNGEPCGHFVVLSGYDREAKKVIVADPYQDNPLGDSCFYSVSMDRLLNSILLGVLTYDANLLILEPKISSPANHA